MTNKEYYIKNRALILERAKEKYKNTMTPEKKALYALNTRRYRKIRKIINELKVMANEYCMTNQIII